MQHLRLYYIMTIEHNATKQNSFCHLLQINCPKHVNHPINKQTELCKGKLYRSRIKNLIKSDGFVVARGSIDAL